MPSGNTTLIQLIRVFRKRPTGHWIAEIPLC
jgi:hypothetical protein